MFVAANSIAPSRHQCALAPIEVSPASYTEMRRPGNPLTNAAD
jgi:hypothetical protein